MAQVQAVGNDNGAGGTTLVVTIAASTAGSLLIAVIGCYGKDVTSVTDNLAQTWTQAYTPGTNTEHPAFWYRANTASGVTTVTATFSVSRQSDMAVLEENGMATASPFDKHAQSTSALSTTWDTGATAATVQADELALCAVASASGSNRSFALDGTSSSAGWAGISGTNITSGRVAATANGFDLFIARRTLSATGAYNASGTCTNSVRVAAIATFKTASTASILRQVRRRRG